MKRWISLPHPPSNSFRQSTDGHDWASSNRRRSLLTDSVTVHYTGRLLPSASYPQGYQFDSSYAGTFDAVTATPTKFAVTSVVKGFSTALMHMHRGDHWRIYIPYQQGYGSVAKSSVPAYSTLIFDLRLEDFWRKTKGDRE